MGDRDRPLIRVGGPAQGAMPDDPIGANPLRRNLLDFYDALSHKIAGGFRTDHRDMLPGANDPLEGIIPDEFLPEVTNIADWFQPDEWSGLGPGDVPRFDLSTIPQPGGKVTQGKGLDFFRSGEAPNNYTNRHNPLYEARREFAVQIAPKLEEMFGVSARGSAGYMRPPSKGDAAPGGRSSNSDHYSGGAIDFFGSKEDMVAMRNWLEANAPWCSFVRCQSESHYDHVHVSIDIGWIAQNYFQGRETPTFSTPTLPTSTRPPTTPRQPSTAPSATSGAGRPI